MRLQSSKAYLGHCADPFAFSKAAEIGRNVESPGRWDVGSQLCHSNTKNHRFIIRDTKPIIGNVSGGEGGGEWPLPSRC